MKLKKPHRLRVVLLGGLFLTLSGAVAARLVTLQVARYDQFEDRANRQHVKRVVIQAERGPILDRNGRTLAQSTGRMTLYVNPNFLKQDPMSLIKGDKDAREAPVVTEKINVQQLAASIARESGEPAADLERRLEGTRPTALLKRMRPEVATRVMDVLDSYNVDGRGYWLHRESIRLYPGSVAAPVVGFCSKDEDGDNTGIAGLELTYNDDLKGERIEGKSYRSAISETLDPWNPEDILAARGNTLVLTIDSNVQQAVEDVLKRTVEKFEAVSGGAVVMDARTGAIIAMGSYPTFDNNNFATEPPDHIRNRALTDPLETGSVVKLFTASMLIDRGYITPETLVDCEGGHAIIDGRRISDAPGHTPLHVVPFRDALRWSSNVGVVKAGQALQNPEWYAYLTNFNFGAPTGIDLPGEGSGILYPLEKWTKFSRTSLPMGYEIAMTPIQITAAISAVVNGGNYYTPYIVQEVRDSRGTVIRSAQPKADRQIIRPTTSAVLRDLMEDIVDSGTGKKAIIPGYRIGGKTGTTQKSNVFTHKEYIASFAGVLPAQAPRIAIYVYIDAPTTEHFASAVAAPAFQEIARSATVNLGIAPSEEIIDETFKDDESAGPFIAQETRAIVAPGQVPDFTGMTMQQARVTLPKGAAKARMLGSGFVSDQFPTPGETFNKDTEIVLHFSPEPPAAPEQIASNVGKGGRQ
ncbi:penicillin-binding protein [soil metagenome]